MHGVKALGTTTRFAAYLELKREVTKSRRPASAVRERSPRTTAMGYPPFTMKRW
jgi:hypothetical protein